LAYDQERGMQDKNYILNLEREIENLKDQLSEERQKYINLTFDFE
jgi:hypothetical protein